MEDERLSRRKNKTHGNRTDIDENTPLSDVKAPNMFERAKEEIEAVVQTIHANRDPYFNDRNSSSSGSKIKLELLPALYSKKLRFHVFYVTDFSSESWKETGFHPASKGGDQAFSKAVPPQGDSTGKRWSRQHHANKGGERSEHICTSKGRSRGHYRNPSALQKGI